MIRALRPVLCVLVGHKRAWAGARHWSLAHWCVRCERTVEG